jgi:hypothetical protein
MRLDDPKIEGFVRGSETFCCRGCAEGTGCTCTPVRAQHVKAGNRKRKIGHRNAENSLRDANYNAKVTTSGRRIPGKQKKRIPLPGKATKRS